MASRVGPVTRAPAGTLIAIGAGAVVLGGLVAAVTGLFGWEHGSWVAAYLVLVVGVAQYAMGRMRPAGPRPDRAGWVQVGAWNLGSLLVIGGTLVATPLLVDLGSGLLLLALVLALRAAWPGQGARQGRSSVLVGPAYRAMLLLLAVSIPVGVLLAHLRR